MDTYRQRALLVFPMLFPLILFAINGSALSKAAEIPGFPTHSYRAFLLAMPFVQGAMFVSISAGTSLARDIETGFLNRLALTPLRSEAMLIGQLGGAVRARRACRPSCTCSWRVALGIDFASGVGGVVDAAAAVAGDLVRRSRPSAGCWRCGSAAAKRSRGSSRCCS